jgi:kynurenine formamidase
MAQELTTKTLEQMFESVKNWGRWGDDDQRGALNLIGDKQRIEAARLVRDGSSVSCSQDLPTRSAPDNPQPALHMMIAAGDACTIPEVPGLETTLDFVGVAYHGMAVSHIDALCHVFVEGKMYNGYPASDVRSTGALKNSIMAGRDGIMSRGVLLDIPRLRGVDWLELGTAIEPEELEAAEEAQGVRVGEGDILLVGTGRYERGVAQGRWAPLEGMAGLHARCVPWLHERDVAVLGSDGISDAVPGPGVVGWPMPLHQCCLVAMGIHLLDNLRLDELAKACAERERWEFMLTIAPLPVARGTGSPVNPIATF